MICNVCESMREDMAVLESIAGEINDFCKELTEYYVALEEKLRRIGAFYSTKVTVGGIHLLWCRHQEHWSICIATDSAQMVRPLIHSSRANKLRAYRHIDVLVHAIRVEAERLKGVIEVYESEYTEREE